MTNLQQFSSGAALGIRFVCIVAALYGSYLVVRQFRKGTLQYIRVRLVAVLLFILLSNIPIQFIHWNKLVGHETSTNLAAIAAITNSLALLIATLALVSIIKFRIRE